MILAQTSVGRQALIGLAGPGKADPVSGREDRSVRDRNVLRHARAPAGWRGFYHLVLHNGRRERVKEDLLLQVLRQELDGARPGVDAADQVRDIAKTRGNQLFRRPQAPHAVVAINDDRAIARCIASASAGGLKIDTGIM